MKIHRTLDDWSFFGSVFNKLGRCFLSTVFGKQFFLFHRILTVLVQRREYIPIPPITVSDIPLRRYLKPVFIAGHFPLATLFPGI